MNHNRRALVADLFCGAGGSSTGAQKALDRLGFAMDLVAVNHWNVAMETHHRPLVHDVTYVISGLEIDH